MVRSSAQRRTEALRADADRDVPAALALQQASCRDLGSPLYADLLGHLVADALAGGVVSELLAGRERLVRDALALRMLGAMHRLALEGQAPAVARHLPSCGGSPGPTLVADVLGLLADRRDDVEGSLSAQVQTNEVGRCAALAAGFAVLADRWRMPLRTFEIGASAGLLSRWCRYAYDGGAAPFGDPASTVRFPAPVSGPIEVGTVVEVAERWACDVAPLDPCDDADRTRLLSFVWPDQTARFARLRNALDIACRDPLLVDAASADDWLGTRFGRRSGTVSVLFHAITWQYLGPAVQERIRAHLERVAGDVWAPTAWLRLEPAGPVARLTLTTWPGGDEEVLAHAAYHGGDLRLTPAVVRT